MNDPTLMYALWQILQRKPQENGTPWKVVKLSACTLLTHIVEGHPPISPVSSNKPDVSRWLDLLETNFSLGMTTELLSLFAVCLDRGFPVGQGFPFRGGDSLQLDSVQLLTFSFGWILRSEESNQSIRTFTLLLKGLLSILELDNSNFGGLLFFSSLLENAKISS